MKINKLASTLARGKWLIEPRTAMVERRRAISFLNGDFDEIEPIEKDFDKPFAIKKTEGLQTEYWDYDDENQFEMAEMGSVAIIPICGTIMKYDYCGSPGTDTLSSWLKQAVASPRIDAIVLLINSGGGSVEGTGEFADLIKSAEKTICTFCDGLMASAAYWIGCAAKEIWASHQTAEFGSIGTAVCFMDDSKYMEEMGFQEVYINADTSPDKNQDVIKAIAGDDKGLKDNIINPTNEIFMSAVKANREGKLKILTEETDGKTLNEPLTGKVYLAETAIEIGLIDGICTLEQCIQKALELKTNENKKSLNSNTMATEDKEKAIKKSTSFLEKLSALLSSKEDDEMTDEEKKAKKAEEDEEAKKAKKEKEDKEAKEKEDEEAKKEKAAKKASRIEAAKKAGKTKKSKKDDDFDDDKNYDEDDDDNSDEDDVEVNGKKISLKNPTAVKAAFAELVEIANKEIADRDALLQDAQTVIAANVAELKKTDEEVRRTIKSTFQLKSSSRSTRLKNDDKAPMLESLIPKEGSKAEFYVQKAIANAKRK